MNNQSTTLPFTPLRIAILGAGRIGSAFAFQLARIGHHDVTVVARPGSKRLQQLQSDNGIVNVSGERANVSVVDTLDEGIPYDLVIVTLLAHQLDAVQGSLTRSPAKCIQFMFNNFEPERLRDTIGAERCSFGMPFVQANFDKDGRLNATIGATKTIMSEQRWVDVFAGAGIPATLEPDMLLWLRCHVPVCIAFESISVAAVRRGAGASWGEAVTIAQGVHEGFALIQGLGYKLYPQAKAYMNSCPSWVLAAVLWLMSRIPSFRDLLATGIDECRALIVALLVAAPQAKPTVRIDKIQAMNPP